MGDTVSHGYENMVMYFNGYYNAKILFSDAEDEIKTAALLARGKESLAGQANQIPATAKQKLDQVIDKCSNILALHSSSSLVDNALMLIGKSFFYQMDYLKSERKFAELLAQFPNSSLALEAQFWYARSEEKLGKFSEGVSLCDAVVIAAEKNNNNEIETQAHKLLGVLYRRMDQTDKSISEYEKAIAISNSDAVKVEAQISLGDIYFKDGQYQKAADIYLQTENYTSDIYLNYYSKLQAAIAYREIGEQKKGLTLVNAMITDFRNKEYLASILYERANNYEASERLNDAINEYIIVDTSYAHTEYSVRSAYQLGLIFEKKLGIYSKALKYYSEVNNIAGPAIAEDSRRKVTAFTRYFDALHRLKIADSLLLVLSDTTRKIIPDTLNTITADSTHKKSVQVNSSAVISKDNSLKARDSGPDSTKRKSTQVAAQSPIPSADSLHILKSIAAQDIGDIFYSEVIEPDSAFSWFNKSLSWSYDKKYSPRVLYILAELSRTNPDKKYPAPEEYFSRLDHDFPESIYAEEARRFLRKASYTVKKDTAFEYYTQSEKQVDAEQYEKAIETLRFIVQSFPKSPFAAKSEYAIGWIMENRLAQPDSALLQYKQVLKNYVGSLYANEVSKRLTVILQPDTAKTDTEKLKNIPQIQKSFSPDSVQRNSKGLEKDTIKNVPVSPLDEMENGQRKKTVVKQKNIE